MKTQKQLTAEDFYYINQELCNNESSSDDELLDLFQRELNISRKLAKRLVFFRTKALNEIDFAIEDCLQ